MEGIQNIENILTEVTEGKNVAKTNLEKFSASNSKSYSRGAGEAGVMSIINSLEHGKRITIAKHVIEALNNCTSLQFAFNQESIAIGEKLPNNESYFSTRKIGTKSVIYNSQLVKEITELFQLDYSNGRVSITFHDVEYSQNGAYPVAIIKVRKPIEQDNEAEAPEVEG